MRITTRESDQGTVIVFESVSRNWPCLLLSLLVFFAGVWFAALIVQEMINPNWWPTGIYYDSFLLIFHIDSRINNLVQVSIWTSFPLLVIGILGITDSIGNAKVIMIDQKLGILTLTSNLGGWIRNETTTVPIKDVRSLWFCLENRANKPPNGLVGVETTTGLRGCLIRVWAGKIGI